jgi:uncharacterized membrane-anchored protein YhcB (DUF1043 family)
MKVLVLLLCGLILGYIVYRFIKENKFKLNLRKCLKELDEVNEKIKKEIENNNKIFVDIKKDIDKDYMKKQLEIKLKMEAELKKVDEETLKKLKESVK